MGYPSRYVEFFGPSMWKTMHSVSFTYPNEPTPEQRMQYIDFFRSIGPVIPCPSCSKHYMDYLEKNPIDADNTDSLANWVYDLHKDVNKRQNKTSPTFKEVKDDYAGWNDVKHKALQRLSPSVKLKKLADPHLGRNPLSKEKTEGTEAPAAFGDGPNKLLLLVLVLVAAFMIFRRRPQQPKKKEESK